MKTPIENPIVKRSFSSDNRQVDYVRFSNDLFNLLLENGEFVNIPINALRVIFNTIAIVRNDQFRPEDRPEQLQIFQKEFETENNTFIKITIKNNSISPTGTKHQIEKAYEYLTNFKLGWHSATNSLGQEIKTYGGFISIPSYDQRGVTSFLINRFWLRKIVVIPEYNPIIFNLIYHIKHNKHILFALWLKTIPITGTSVLLSTFNKKFGLRYSKAGDFCTKFLFGVRKNLDKYNDRSFRYKYIGDLIQILPYENKKIEDDLLSEKTSQLINTKYRLRYYQTRFHISEKNMKNLKNEYLNFTFHRKLIESSYKQFVKNCRLKKIRSTVFRDSVFLEELQIILIEEYRETASGMKLPNGYPIITSNF